MNSAEHRVSRQEWDRTWKLLDLIPTCGRLARDLVRPAITHPGIDYQQGTSTSLEPPDTERANSRGDAGRQSVYTGVRHMFINRSPELTDPG